MAIQFGPLLAEVIDPESEKFTSSLVLVHGLWERAVAWRPFAGYLAHRGWRCIALQRRNDPAAGMKEHVDDLRAALGAVGPGPVVIGHDLGALLALHCLDRARAVVALAPLVGPPLGRPSLALERAGNWLTRWRGGALSAPRGRWRAGYPSRDIGEAAALLRQVAAAYSLPPPNPTVAAAVFAVQDDPITPLSAAGALAEHVGAELQVFSGSEHRVMLTPGWEARVAAVHRWIVQRLGVDLLALYDESMNPD